MRKEGKVVWEGRLRSAKSSGFAMPITSLLDALSVRRLHPPDSGEMGATRLVLPPSCSMSMSRPLRTGARLASWRVFVPPLWDPAGLPSLLTSSPLCASHPDDRGSNGALIMHRNFW